MTSPKLIEHPFLFISLIFISLINSAQVAEGAPLSARVKVFPGYTGNLRSEIYSGYVTVDEAHGRQLFYYFIESERNPAEDPLLIWLTGGPGCSSFGGLIYEIGPFNFDYTEDYGDLPKVHQNSHSWTKVSNIIFLDSPVGTGYSYSNTTEDYATGDFKTASDVHTFLIKWFEEYPEFLSNPLYVGGDSYGGIFVPLVAQEIVNGIKAGIKPTLKLKVEIRHPLKPVALKGYLVGNGVTDGEYDNKAQLPFVHGMGLISDELYQAVEDTCNGSYSNPPEGACTSNLQAVRQDLSRINLFNILDPICYFVTEKQESVSTGEDRTGRSNQVSAARRRMSGHAWLIGSPIVDGYVPSKLQYGLQDNPCDTVDISRFSEIWANNPSVRKAIHAQTEEITGVWQRCAFNRLTYVRDVQSVVEYHLNLTTNGYRALLYSGDHDMGIPFIGTQAWIRSLGYAIVDEWRPWFVDGQVAGYTRAYDNNLTFATIKGAGHIAAGNKPRQAFVMFKQWISEELL